MGITLLGADGVAERLHNRLGFAADSDEAIAETLRAELTARGNAQRARLLLWTSERLAIESLPAEDQIERVCTELERVREVLVGPGGRSFPGPLRVVHRPDGLARVLCGAPTAVVADVLGVQLEILGVRRTVPDTEALRDAVNVAGGLVLSLDEWSGVAGAPVADARFAQRLDTRLTQTPDANSTDHLTREWHAVGADAKNARLWRYRHADGSQRYAWTQPGQRPGRTLTVTLSSDEAHRASYALEPGPGTQVEARTVDDAPERLRILLPFKLPSPEFRWLREVAAGAPYEGGFPWEFRAGALGYISEMLNRRLRVEVKS